MAHSNLLIKLAKEAGFHENVAHTVLMFYNYAQYAPSAELERFARLIQDAEREKVVQWQIRSGYSTGHGDTIEDLLVELEWQVRESEREADLRGELDRVKRERDELVGALNECRSSVKFDLYRYEKMAIAYGRLAPEGRQTLEMAEAEANRLGKLLDAIDALAKLGADKTGEVK